MTNHAIALYHAPIASIHLRSSKKSPSVRTRTRSRLSQNQKRHAESQRQVKRATICTPIATCRTDPTRLASRVYYRNRSCPPLNDRRAGCWTKNRLTTGFTARARVIARTSSRPNYGHATLHWPRYHARGGDAHRSRFQQNLFRFINCRIDLHSGRANQDDERCAVDIELAIPGFFGNNASGPFDHRAPPLRMIV